MINLSKNGFSHTCRALALTAAAVAALTGPALANGFTEDVGSSERVNFSGQLGTLSERITAAACNLSAGIATIESQAVLNISTFHFTRINRALLEGNRGMGILGEESRPRTLRAISELNAKWEPLRDMANATPVGAQDRAYVENLANQSEPVQEEAKILVSEITGQYADPAVLQHADAMLLEIAGRQRMLANRISKDVCLIASDVNNDTALAQLNESIQLFDVSLQALQNGMETVGIRPPPTEQIAQGLADVGIAVDGIRPILQAAQGGQELSDEDRAKVFRAMLGVEAKMNNVVHWYQQNSKLNL